MPTKPGEKHKSHKSSKHHDLKGSPKNYYDRCIRLLRKYGITCEDYNNMFNQQEGKCSICKVHQSDLKATLVVDHDHKTGKVRSLLCQRCNKVLGFVYEDIELLENSIKYLKIYKE